MASNLVPEKRQDRNGKSTLRWVRMEEVTDSKGRRIPAVDIALRRIREQKATEAIFPEAHMFSRESAVRSVISKLNRSMPDVLDRIVAAAQDDDDVAENIRILIEGPNLIEEPVSIRKSYELTLRVQPYTKKMMTLLHPEEEDDDWVRDVMFRMEKIVDDTRSVLGTGDDVTKAVIIVSIIEGMEDENGMSTEELLRTEDDIRYIASNLDAVEEIALELMKRGSYHQGLIEEMLGSTSKPLVDGIL